MKDWLIEQDRLIRAGYGLMVSRELRSRLKQGSIEREDAMPVAALCRRTSLFEQATQVLYPYIRPGARRVVEATPKERLEYAASLVQLGGEFEGNQILSGLDSGSLPQVLLFQAMSLFSKWDYESAIPLLQTYSQNSNITTYERLIGEVNLAAALVACGQIAGKIDKLIQQTATDELRLLHANLLEIKAQSLINQKKFSESHELLDKAAALLESMGNRDALFVKKWQAVIRILDGRDVLRGLQDLQEVRATALTDRQVEVVRNCDFYIAMGFDKLGQKTEMEGLLLKLYFGTPFLCFRKRIIDEFQFRAPSLFDYKIDGTGPTVPGILLRPYQLPLQLYGMKSGQVLHRLFLLLIQDFYRTQRLAKVHEELFPGRVYDPTTSPALVHQAVNRFRKWILKSDLPLQIVESRSEYHLSGTSTQGDLFCGRSQGLVKNQGESKDSVQSGLLIQIEHKFLNLPISDWEFVAWIEGLKKHVHLLKGDHGVSEFVLSDILPYSKVSRRATQVLIKKAIEKNLLVKVGEGKLARYQFAN